MRLPGALTALMLAAAMALAACGDDDGGGGSRRRGRRRNPLSIDVTDQGIEAPQSVEAGLVEITLTNSGKGSHEAQLIRLEEATRPSRR